MSKHTYETVLSICAGGDEHEPTLRVGFTVYPGYPDTMEEPGCGATVELSHAEICVGEDWITAPEWLFGMLYTDSGFHAELLQSAAEDHEAALEYRAEMRREAI